MSKYSDALGLGTASPLTTELTFKGVGYWGLSKAPALLGGVMADFVYRAAVRRWPNHRRGAAFVGGVAVVLAAFAIQLAMQRFAKNATQLADRMTDGMIGRVSEAVIVVFKSFIPQDKGPPGTNAEDYRNLRDVSAADIVLPAAGGPKAALPAAATGPVSTPQASTGPLLPDFANGLDGDSEAAREVAGLMHNSPEFTQEIAERMFQTMRKEGVKIDDGGREAVIRSMRQAAQSFAAEKI